MQVLLIDQVWKQVEAIQQFHDEKNELTLALSHSHLMAKKESQETDAAKKAQHAGRSKL